jgi:hypothetical protein
MTALDSVLTGSLDGAPLLAVLAVAALLGLRHALDPDHVVAVTSLVAARERDVRAAVRVGTWWGVGHSLTLILLGAPLILVEGTMPGWFEAGAEKAIGVVIAVLGARVLWTWRRSGVRLTQHVHPPAPPHRHAHHTDGGGAHPHSGRTRAQAVALGSLHGLAGTGAVVLLLLASLSGPRIVIAALILFAGTTIVSMALCTAGFAWVLTRPRLEPVGGLVVRTLGGIAVVFGLVYAGL